VRAVICGGGVIGAACAYYLSLRGVETLIVEPTGIAAAASGRSGGFLARDWCDATPQQSLARLSYGLHQQLAGTLDADYGYRPVTTRLVVASERRDVSRHARVPAPAWLDGRGAVASTLGDPSNTAQLDPAAPWWMRRAGRADAWSARARAP
jgi:glycine/D-amino acid oxidase-like deaminating enzyme